MTFTVFTKHIQTGTGPAPTENTKPGYQDWELTDAYIYEFGSGALGSDGNLIVKGPGGDRWIFAASNWEMIHVSNDHPPGKTGKPFSPPIADILKEKLPLPPHL